MDDAYRAALHRFEDDLRARRLSPHTVRGYLADVADLFAFAERTGAAGPTAIGLDIARSWLAESAAAGAARTTLARRTAAARAWSRNAGLPALSRLATPKPRSPLPTVLSHRQMSDTLTGAAAEATTNDPLALRDAAILEFLYATAARVSELCALNVDDLDFDRRTARLTGKGGRERTVPFGLPAERALHAWLAENARGAVLAGRVGGGGGNQKTAKKPTTPAQATMPTSLHATLPPTSNAAPDHAAPHTA
ncbi:MAG: tyrosine-type recombinase/integrase, partial [Catenulispora sp.]|nr:tyrosine-type recombinase/integrase [Catenulispora sp.]